LRPFDPDEEEQAPPDEQYEPLGTGPDVTKLASEAFEADTAEANGSSIAFIAESWGRRVLLAADAHSAVLEEALGPLARTEGDRYRIDLLKMSHHGSAHNTSPEMPKHVDCTRFAISTDGTSIRMRKRSRDCSLPIEIATLYFNYRQSQTELWENHV
jgi:hypothetical protein